MLTARAPALSRSPSTLGRYDIVFLPPSFPIVAMENPCLTFIISSILESDEFLIDHPRCFPFLSVSSGSPCSLGPECEERSLDFLLVSCLLVSSSGHLPAPLSGTLTHRSFQPQDSISVTMFHLTLCSVSSLLYGPCSRSVDVESPSLRTLMLFLALSAAPPSGPRTHPGVWSPSYC